MKNFTLTTKLTLCMIFMLVSLSISSQQIGIFGNGQPISDNSGNSPALNNFTDFGASTSRIFTLENIQNGNPPSLNITSIVLSNNTEFNLSTNPSPVGLGKSDTADFTIDYVGLSAGTYTSTVTVNSNASNDGGDNAWVFTISITVAPEIDIVDSTSVAIDDGGGNSPSTANSTAFGSTDTSTPITRTYTIENNGNAALNISSTSSNNMDFAITLSTPTSVSSGNQITFTVTFSPTLIGSTSAIITINNNDSDEGVYTFNVQGTATAGPPEFTIYYENFDENDGGWTTTGSGTVWTRGNILSTISEFGEGNYWYTNNFNDYADNTNATLVSPIISTVGYTNIEFSADLRYNLNADNDDGMRVEYRERNLGIWTSWTVLGANGEGNFWYDGNGNVDALGTGSDGWTGDTTNTQAIANYFQTAKILVPITLSNSNEVQFRFVFASDNDGVVDDGVVVDNILIHADPIVAFADPTFGPGSINSDLKLWLKATKEWDVLSDDTGIVSWTDSAFDNNSISTTAARPSFKDNATDNINFNPVIEFDRANQEFMRGKGGFFAQDYFVVIKSNNSIDYLGTNRQVPLAGREAGENPQIDGTGLGLCNISVRFNDEVVAHMSSSVGNDPANESWGKSYSSTTDSYTDEVIIYNVKSNATRTDTEIYKNGKRIDNSVGRTQDGSTNLLFHEFLNNQYYVGVGRFSLNGNVDAYVDGRITEIVSYKTPNSTLNQQKIQSYLALKNGVTLHATNSVTEDRLNDVDYIDSQGSIIWDNSANTGYNYDIAGIGRDDRSEFIQKQSASENKFSDGTGLTSGFLSMALTETYATNKENIDNNSDNFSDRNFIVWGNNNADINATPSTIAVDMSANITGLNTNVSFIGMQRVWKVIETGDVGKVQVSIPEDAVRNITPPGNYLMFISDDGIFTPTAQYRVMSSDGNGNLRAEYDFPDNSSRYITFGYAPEVIVERSINFVAASQNYIDAEDNLDLDAVSSSAFTISSWIKREAGSTNSSILSKRDLSYTEGYDLKINASNQVEMSWYNSGTLHTIQSNLVGPDFFPENEWHHVAVTHDGTTATLFIDGVLETTSSIPMPEDTDNSFLMAAAGRDGNTTAHFEGNIDEVRVWNVALTDSQIQFLMNQELENNAGTIGKYFNSNSILPTKNDASAIDFSNLRAYFPMSRYTYTNTNDESGRGLTGYLRQLRTVDYQTAPLPYISTQNGDWTDNSTWINGNLQYIPGSRSLADNDISVDWNIIETSHDITINNTALFDDTVVNSPDPDGNDNEGNRTVLAHIQNSGTITVDGDNTAKTGFGYTITHYLEMSGKIDLEGESQLIQTLNSDLILGPSAELEKDQQGVTSTYHYNYWSSPVGETSIAPASLNPNRHAYAVTDVMRDGASAVNFTGSGYDGSDTNPITIADYWIWKFANNPDGDYSAWEHVRRTGNIEPGEGFTMKGPGSSGTEQNYTFLGKPNNADINLTINQYNDYLVGNPYASAIDARQFIIDNGGTLFYDEGRINIVLDGSGNPELDGNGHPIYQDVNENEYTMQVIGVNPVNDLNGNPIYEDENGNPHYVLLDSGGSPVLDGNGYVVYIITGSVAEADATTSGTLYFWEHWGGGDHILQNYQGGYGTYNLSGSIAAPFSMTGTSDADVSQTGSGTKAPGRYIPVGQGFFVVADNGGTINFNNGQRIFKKESAANGEFFRTANQNTTTVSNQTTDEVDTRHKLKLGFDSAGEQHRQLLLTIDENTTPGVDWGYDATTYEYKNDDMFWGIENNFYVIQASNLTIENPNFPLIVYTSEDGNNTIKIDELINFEENQYVYLHDIELDFYQNLKEGDYEIFLNAGYYDTRFEIVFSERNLNQNQSLSTDDEILNEAQIDIRYANNIDKIVLINPHGLQVKTIQVFNILGQEIISIDKIESGNYTEYNVGTLSSGPYIIKLNTVSGSVSKKVLVN